MAFHCMNRATASSSLLAKGILKPFPLATFPRSLTRMIRCTGRMVSVFSRLKLYPTSSALSVGRSIHSSRQVPSATHHGPYDKWASVMVHSLLSLHLQVRFVQIIRCLYSPMRYHFLYRLYLPPSTKHRSFPFSSSPARRYLRFLFFSSHTVKTPTSLFSTPLTLLVRVCLHGHWLCRG